MPLQQIWPMLQATYGKILRTVSSILCLEWVDLTTTCATQDVIGHASFGVDFKTQAPEAQVEGADAQRVEFLRQDVATFFQVGSRVSRGCR